MGTEVQPSVQNRCDNLGMHRTVPGRKRQAKLHSTEFLRHLCFLTLLLMAFHVPVVTAMYGKQKFSDSDLRQLDGNHDRKLWNKRQPVRQVIFHPGQRVKFKGLKERQELNNKEEGRILRSGNDNGETVYQVRLDNHWLIIDEETHLPKDMWFKVANLTRAPCK